MDFVFLFHGFMFCVAWFDCVAFGFILRTSFSIHLHLQCVHLQEMFGIVYAQGF